MYKYLTYILNAFFKNRKKDKGSLNNTLLMKYMNIRYDETVYYTHIAYTFILSYRW